jgi:hypothetical protein
LSADRKAREASIENQKIQIGRKLNGRDMEWNAEDDAATGTGAAVGAGVGAGAALAAGALGAKIGATALSWSGPIGLAIGAAAGLIVGAVVGAISSNFDNDATDDEKKALDALYEAYKEQGDAALTEDGVRRALRKEGIYDEGLITSLAANEKATKELMQAMEANTAAIEAERLSIAT